jgi:hypothetical protein
MMENLHDIDFSNDFQTMTAKVQTTKVKTGKLGFIEIKTFGHGRMLSRK